METLVKNGYTLKKAGILNRLLGYKKGITSFSKLYKGGSLNAFGSPSGSMHTLKHEFKTYFDEGYYPKSGLIRFISVHTTYFTPTKEVEKLNEYLKANDPQTIDKCIEFLKTL